MRIGILTLPLIDNYGGILQAFALQKYLSEKGHEVILIDRHFNDRPFKPFAKIIKRFFFPERIKKQLEEKAIKKNLSNFIKGHINPKTEPLRSLKALRRSVEKYNFDAVIVGSDQVWRTSYTKKMTPDYFLQFVEQDHVKKIAYAASFGKDTWEADNVKTKLVKNLLERFDAISVREESGIEICSSVFDVDALQHIDPTMLLSKEDYRYLIEKEREPERTEDILIYMLDINEDRQQVIDRVISNKKGKPFNINSPVTDKQISLKEKIKPTVTNWLKGFFDAKFIITDSFHGTLFSLLHNKPFLVYGNEKRGLTRFYSMLKKVNLQHRIIVKSSDLNDNILNQEIDWDFVNNELRKERQDTYDYFKSLGI